MFKAIKFLAIFFSFLLLNGCASSCGSSVDTNSNGQTNEVIVPKKADNAQVQTNSNANIVNGITNANLKNPTLDNSKVKVVDTSKAKTEPPKTKAPDNSEVSTKSVGKAFVETRQFLKHQQLDKVEKIINSGTDIKFKVYLKNGKTYDLEESKLKEYRKMSANDILKTVGVTPVEVRKQDSVKEKKEIEEKMKKKPNS